MPEIIIPIVNKPIDYGDLDKPIYDIKGAAFESFNFFLGYVDEKSYSIGMMMELQDKGYKVYREATFNTYYKGRNSGVTRRMDMVVETSAGTIILELKALQSVNDKERRQLWAYMRQMNCQIGMLINFPASGKVYTEVWVMNNYNFKCKRYM